MKVVTTKTPDEVGFENRKNWDCNLIAHWIMNTYGVEYKQRSILDVLHHLNLSYTRPTTGKHWGVKLLGTLDYETGRIICSEEERYDVHGFLRFLEKVMQI